MLIFAVTLFANQELEFYTIKKYNKDYNKLNTTQKKQISDEYSKLIKVSNLLKKEVEDIPAYKTINSLTILELWSNHFMNNYNPSEEEIKALYAKLRPKTIVKYKLRNIIVKFEASANKIINKLNNIKEKKKKLDTFVKYVSRYSTDFKTINRDGNLGWVTKNQLNKNVQKQLEGKKDNDLVKINVDNNGWEILFIEKYVPRRDATYKESKKILISTLKKNALARELKMLLN